MPRTPAFLMGPTTKKGQRVGDYILGKSIKKGGCSKVRLARHLPTGAWVIVKTILRRGLGVSSSNRELRCLITLQHKNITRLLEVVVEPDQVHLVLEHVQGGDLGSHLHQRGRLTERQARTVFQQVFTALHLCHRRGFAHRDIKPDNILLQEDLSAKLADFGLSCEAPEGRLLTSHCGTMYYMAPEVLRGVPYDGRKADVWSLGASLYTAMTGRVLYSGNSDGKIMQSLQGYQPPYYMSEQGRSFLQRLLTVDPAQRPTLEEAMRMPWLALPPEDLQPDSPPPAEELDPQVVEAMRGMGYREEAIRKSVAGQTFDSTMGTYRILLMTMGRLGMGRMPGRTVKVRSAWPPDTWATAPSWPAGGSPGPSASPPRRWARKIYRPPPPSPESRSSSPIPLGPVPEAPPLPPGTGGPAPQPQPGTSSPAPQQGTSSPAPQQGTGGPAPQLGTSSPAPQPRPGGAPTPRARSGEIQAAERAEDPQGAPPGRSPPAGSPPAAPAADTRAWRGLAQRAWRAFLKAFCCGLDTTEPRTRTARGHPGNN